MTNAELAKPLALYGKLLEVHGENSFKAKNYATAAYSLEHLSASVADMDEATLYQQRGIGRSSGEKIIEILQTGQLGVLVDLLAQTPEGVLELLSIKGLGPKKIHAIWKLLGVETVGELEYACLENRLVALSGFGAKTQQSILDNIAFYRASQGFHLWGVVEGAAISALESLRRAFPANRFEFYGDFKRHLPVVNGIEILTDTPLPFLRKKLGAAAGLVPSEDDTQFLRFESANNPSLQIQSCPPIDFARTLFQASAATEFLEAFRKDYVLPEAVASEEELFERNGLAFIPSFYRESAFSLALAKNGQLPSFIQPGDIRGMIHNHSTYSDGANTLEEMAKGARDAGYEYLVISDHSQSAAYAGGLRPERVLQQHEEIDRLNEQLAPFKIFKSIESDILNDGSLDYEDDFLQRFDLVIASVHSNLGMTEEKAMERLLRAVAHPATRILGHPSGRLLLSRKGYPLDYRRLIEACAEHKVVLEINANPRRLDLDWTWIPYALECGVLLSINPDAHRLSGYDDCRFGVMAAQKGGLTAAQNLSSFTRIELEDWLRRSGK
ncbi:MAG: DNA polymerase/3'-5' exonuclease PolX [Bacteroidetes bacterium]|nr:DNA polymerase/3'-5' exonuclease PolX [Bacteroidota bacterium]